MFTDLNNLYTLLAIGFGTAAFLIQYAGLIWKLSTIEKRIYEKIADYEKNAASSIQNLRHELDVSKLDIAEKYLKKETFKEVLSDLNARSIRLEGKLDSLLSFNSSK